MQLLIMWDAADDGVIPLPEALDSDRDDFLVVWREWGSGYPGGFRTHIVAVGVFESVSEQDIDYAMAHLEPHLEETP